MRLVLALVATAAVLAGCGGETATQATTTVTKYSYITSPASTVAEAAPPVATTAPAGPPTAMLTDGTYVVGVDVAPGVYRSSGGVSGRECYWKRLSSLDTSDIIDNNRSPGPQTVEIMPADKAFVTSHCSAWSKAN